MHRGQTTESWTTKQPLFYTDAWFQRKSASIVLFAVSFRSCLVFSNSAVSLLVLLLFCGKVLMIWSTECRGQNGKKNWWKFSWENLSTLCGKARRTSQGYGNYTNSEFAEFLLHRESSASSPHNGNSNNRGREEISLELDDISPVAVSIVFLQFLSIWPFSVQY